jgi:hypothetical protein
VVAKKGKTAREFTKRLDLTEEAAIFVPIFGGKLFKEF